jgi:tRNA1(Val) A37 N6-methylase TrmN6
MSKKLGSILKYSQPDFYKFNNDSVELAKLTASSLRELSNLKILDLCSGCGVVGIEFSRHHESVDSLHCVELQSEFESYLNTNLQSLDCKTSYSIEDFKSFSPLEKYDVVVSNPPYFKEGNGRISPNENRQKCRFYSDQEIELLLKKCLSLVTTNGSIFISHREDLREYDSRFRLLKEISGAKLFGLILNKDRG